AQTLSVSASGSYNVMVTDPLTGCMNSDTITVTINAVPVVALGADITQCGGTVVMDAGNAGMNYLWNDGTTTQTLTVSTPGTYYVMVTDPVTNCMGSDTIVVMINANPTVALGADVIQCGGTVVLNAGNSGMDYLWSDNSTGQMLTVSASGTYYVTVIDSASACSGSDTVDVLINALPSVTFTLATSTVCVDDGSFTLTGGSPATGIYSGTGVSGGVFSPGTAGTGPHVITYTYVDQTTGCVNSATQTISVNACVGIAEQSADGIRVYPNPTSGILNVETSATESTIEVYNAVGELVESQQVNNGSAKVDLSTRENGIYFVRISTADSTRIEKIIVQH
ncbi:MAG TPA: T9SS type A sorting domain-containing protein, partial [Bacteroidia bacterium]|nr:T9SS type A sorting domain-containing protein [Bacteroidia bacterium]